jgi:hypothetical protein
MPDGGSVRQRPYAPAAPIIEAEFGKPLLLNITSTTWAALNAAPKPLGQKPDPKWGKVLANC